MTSLSTELSAQIAAYQYADQHNKMQNNVHSCLDPCSNLIKQFNAFGITNPQMLTTTKTTAHVMDEYEKKLAQVMVSYTLLPSELCAIILTYSSYHVDVEYNQLLVGCSYKLNTLSTNGQNLVTALASDVQCVILNHVALLSNLFTNRVPRVICFQCNGCTDKEFSEMISNKFLKNVTKLAIHSQATTDKTFFMDTLGYFAPFILELDITHARSDWRGFHWITFQNLTALTVRFSWNDLKNQGIWGRLQALSCPQLSSITFVDLFPIPDISLSTSTSALTLWDQLSHSSDREKIFNNIQLSKNMYSTLQLVRLVLKMGQITAFANYKRFEEQLVDFCQSVKSNIGVDLQIIWSEKTKL